MKKIRIQINTKTGRAVIYKDFGLYQQLKIRKIKRVARG